MSLKVKCPKGCKLRVPNRRSGTVIRCPKCRAIIRVPGIEGMPAGGELMTLHAELVSEAYTPGQTPDAAQESLRDQWRADLDSNQIVVSPTPVPPTAEQGSSFDTPFRIDEPVLAEHHVDDEAIEHQQEELARRQEQMRETSSADTDNAEQVTAGRPSGDAWDRESIESRDEEARPAERAIQAAANSIPALASDEIPDLDRDVTQDRDDHVTTPGADEPRPSAEDAEQVLGDAMQQPALPATDDRRHPKMEAESTLLDSMSKTVAPAVVSPIVSESGSEERQPNESNAKIATTGDAEPASSPATGIIPPATSDPLAETSKESAIAADELPSSDTVSGSDGTEASDLAATQQSNASSGPHDTTEAFRRSRSSLKSSRRERRTQEPKPLPEHTDDPSSPGGHVMIDRRSGKRMEAPPTESGRDAIETDVAADTDASAHAASKTPKIFAEPTASNQSPPRTEQAATTEADVADRDESKRTASPPIAASDNPEPPPNDDLVLVEPPIEAAPSVDGALTDAVSTDAASTAAMSTDAMSTDRKSAGRKRGGMPSDLRPRSIEDRHEDSGQTPEKAAVHQRTLPETPDRMSAENGIPQQPTAATAEAEPGDGIMPQETVGLVPDFAKQQASRAMAMVMVMAGIFTMGPSIFDLAMGLQQGPLMDVERWVFVLFFLGGVHFLYAAYLAQLPDWSSMWVVSILMLVLTCFDALCLGGLFIGNVDGPVARALQITVERRSQAMLWVLCMMSIHALLSYFCGREAMRWKSTFDIFVSTLD